MGWNNVFSKINFSHRSLFIKRNIAEQTKLIYSSPDCVASPDRAVVPSLSLFTELLHVFKMNCFLLMDDILKQCMHKIDRKNENLLLMTFTLFPAPLYLVVTLCDIRHHNVGKLYTKMYFFIYFVPGIK